MFVIWHCLLDNLRTTALMLRVDKDIQNESWARYAFAFGFAVTIEDCSANTAPPSQQAMHHLRAAYASVKGAMASARELADIKLAGRQAAAAPAAAAASPAALVAMVAAAAVAAAGRRAAALRTTGG